jgi:hypothetical protein
MNRQPFFRKGPYTEQRERLVAACNWLGIERGRAARYSKLIGKFFEDEARAEQHSLAIGASCEMVDLFALWEHRAIAFPGLAGKLRTVCSKGPLRREAEHAAASSKRARNDACGSLVAGRLLAAGVPVVAVDGILTRETTCASEAAVPLPWYGTRIDIECKRPRSYAA